MRLVPCFLLTFGFVRAQYFSEGWTPGQAVPTETVEAETITGTPTSTATPAAKWSWQEFSSKHLDFGKFVTEGPIATALSGIGINATEQLELARQRAAERGWDERIPLLTDSNFETLVKNETFDTPEEAEKRTWFVVVTIGKQDTMSKYVDEVFDNAYQLALDAGDAEHVKWARVDYLAETEITTDWMVWKPPTLIVIKDKGNALRFYQPGQIVLDSAMLHKFVALDGWKETEPWSGPWAPGGSRQPYLHAYAVLSRRAYNIISALPRWIILLVTGAIGSFIINFFHKDDGRPKPAKWNQKKQTPAQQANQNAAEKAKANSGQTQTTAVAPSPSSATKRQVKKKA
ncbi:putative transmembrane protein [Rhizoctonia solani 123E]|uniref:Putative transmembrane protein n=1 Tax=Rhizoctonia solani 123E TaxID=1423351 RepID=A0A074S9Y0_9AGAM|nr:putative transmembrane protein [Rhizoctonia solani 123E]